LSGARSVGVGVARFGQPRLCVGDGGHDVRVAYSGTFQSGYTSEDASYTATESFSSLVQRVEAAAKAAGWTTGTLEEGTSANGRTTGRTG